MISELKFRDVMGHFATGVTVVTTRGSSGRPLGMTVNAFTSVSLEPMLVLVCIHKEATSHDPLLQTGVFAVNILDREQGPVAARFAASDALERFRDFKVVDGPLGSPLLPGALAWLECRVESVVPGGDHSVIMGEVLACGARDGEPLLFFRGTMVGWVP